MSRTLLRRSAWLALFALVLQLGLPLAHFCSLDPGKHPHGTERSVASPATLLPPGLSTLREANPLPRHADHDHATCPICRSLQRPQAAELPTTYAWSGARLTGVRFAPVHLVSVSPEPDWNSSSPRGPPRSS
jgi:hypothetical protein